MGGTIDSVNAGTRDRAPVAKPGPCGAARSWRAIVATPECLLPVGSEFPSNQSGRGLLGTAPIRGIQKIKKPTARREMRVVRVRGAPYVEGRTLKAERLSSDTLHGVRTVIRFLPAC
jgi:hypothetical protein